ncbi:MAG: hypothetical protein mread185_000311 [Mycoplasmataceae bacterium]|nr:MAG: hypothetical protein mread185_000311 [Mycoplasmataceae bacterium]
MPIIKEPLKVECFRCSEKITINFSQRIRAYSQKNSWSYWTEKSELVKKKKNKEYICDDCLLELYYRHKKEFRIYIPNEKKRNLLKLYISEGKVGVNKPFLMPE